MTASQHMVQANGLRFRAMVDGPADGDMFILLHGFPEGAESWAKQVDALAKAGHLAVAPRSSRRSGGRMPTWRVTTGALWSRGSSPVAIRR